MCSSDLTALKGGFFSYIAGTAAVMTQKYKINQFRTSKVNKNSTTNIEKLINSETYSESGTDEVPLQRGIHIINYKNDLPMGKGLSSSAAVCVLVAKCFNEVCLSVCLSVFVSVCVSLCLSVCMSLCLSVSLCICLSVCLCVCLSVS